LRRSRRATPWFVSDASAPDQESRQSRHRRGAWYFGAHSLKSLERNIVGFGGIGPVRGKV
jgi:hypothetical protein